jgi:hypothetical protein
MSGSANTHARLAPSASKCWTNCTAQPGYLASVQHLLPEEQDSPYAAEGTKAHDYAEELLLGLTDLDGIPEEFRKPVGFYVDHCTALAEGAITQIVEAQVPLFYSPDETGTCDFIAVQANLDGTTRWIIRDYKHGMGVPVDAVENTQLAIYAFSFINQAFKSKIAGVPKPQITDTVDIGIVQPRYHGDDPIKTWQLTVEELVTFCEPIRDAAAGIRNGDEGEFKPGDEVCRWCRAKAICPARREWMVAPLLDELPAAEETLATLPTLDRKEAKLPVEERLAIRGEHTADTERLVAVWNNRKAITAWLDDIDEYLTQLAHQGRPAAGTKLVIGRGGNRTWADEEAADKLLKGKLKQLERYNFKLISPAQAAEILNLENQSSRFKNLFDKLVTRSEGKPVLAHESDKREAVAAAVDSLPDEVDDL